MPIRVLHVLNGLGRGGTESFIMNVYRAIDKEKVQFDFLVRSTKDSAHEEEIKRLGGKIFITPEFPRHFLKNKKAVKKFFGEHKDEYVAVHVHANALMYVEPLKVAKKAGVKKIIIHSHSVKAYNPLYKILHQFNKKRIGKWVTHRFACSQAAGEWAYEDDFIVVNNGIRLDRFGFNPQKREKMRADLGLQDAFVIGNVGRFVPVKNHEFLISVFEEIRKEKPYAKLLLCGDGELRESIEMLVAEKGLKDEVIFTGNVTNVEDYLQAMDVFLLPSKYEGAPIALIEAQSTGLFCVASKSVPHDCCIKEVLYTVSLERTAQEWADQILQSLDGWERRSRVEDFIKKGYSVEQTAKFLQEVYLSKE